MRNSVIMGMGQTPTTLIEAVRFFENPVNCREYMVSRRWPNGVKCPQCGSDSVYFDSSRNGWECKTRHPKRKFTLKTGTIFPSRSRERLVVPLSMFILRGYASRRGSCA